jgi:DNA processing protein
MANDKRREREVFDLEELELRAWLAWNRVPGIGPARFYKLWKKFGSMADAWREAPERLQPLIGAKAVAGWNQAKNNNTGSGELELICNNNFRVYCYADPDYPANLKKIPDPPPVLYCWGRFEHGDDVAVAIVGTRRPSPLGIFHARQLSGQLSRQGLTIVSGMARGIDSEAHGGALEAGGRTVAVLGCGLNVVYPPENGQLMAEIARRGAVVSEYPLGTQPVAGNFPARNRIISGLSLGVVVVEAAHDSGSLITADFAADQGRDVFAIPGNIEHEGSKGPHKLIREGAKLVEDYRDILEELAIPPLAPAEINAALTGQMNPLEQKVYEVLTREPVHVNQIQRRAELAAAQVNYVLTQLELKGVVKRFPGQLYLKVK